MNIVLFIVPRQILLLFNKAIQKYQTITKYSIKIQIKGACLKTSLLRRLQAQTLPDAASPIGKVHPFSKIAVTLEPVMRY